MSIHSLSIPFMTKIAIHCLNILLNSSRKSYWQTCQKSGKIFFRRGVTELLQPALPSIVSAEMTEWQTCKIEGLVSNRSCGFKSHFPHPYSFPIVGSCFFCTKDSPLAILQWILSIAWSWAPTPKKLIVTLLSPNTKSPIKILLSLHMNIFFI